jgi:D-alanine transaminase
MAELRDAGIAFEEREFSMEELRRAREAFITSATSFVKPITKVDGMPVGDGEVGPVVRKLFEIFARHVKGAMRNAA